MSRILVTGAQGLVGSAIAATKTDHDFIFVGRSEADLTNESEVARLFDRVKPEWVIHTGALCGGVGGNLAGPADYFRVNVLMNAHVIHHAWRVGVQKLLGFSSVCVFPEGTPVLREDLMHKGEPYYGNFAYAHAKRMVDIQIEAYKNQHGVKNYASIIPGNLFGPHDNYNLQHGHVLPCLIHKIYLAKRNNTPLVCWGNGSARREFIYSQDLARMILQIIELDEIPQRVIITGTEQMAIKQIVERLCKAADFTGEVLWDTSKPNGQDARKCDTSVLKSIIEPSYTNLDEALRQSYWWFATNYERARK